MKILDPIRTEGKETVIVAGSFAPAGTGAPTDVRGKGFSVARTSAGLFTITFYEKYYQMNMALATLQQATGGDQFLQVGTYTAATASADATLTVRLWDVSGAAVDDQAANANNRVNFMVIFSNTSVS